MNVQRGDVVPNPKSNGAQMRVPSISIRRWLPKIEIPVDIANFAAINDRLPIEFV